MSEDKLKKTFFLKEVIKSIKDLDKYEDFALESPKKALGYLLKMVLIFVLIITAFYTYKIVDNLNNIYVNFKNNAPEFSYSDGKLKIENQLPIIVNEYEQTLGKIILDTSADDIAKKEYEEEIKKDGFGILFLEDKFTAISADGMGQISYNYSDLMNSYNISKFTKQDVINFVDNINIANIYLSIYFMVGIYLFLIYFISIILDVCLLAILVYIVSRISRISLKFAPSFNIAIHSITLPMLLNLIYIIVNLLTGYNIKYFQVMYNTISYIYAIVAVLMIKTDFINRQMELIKLEQEREKVREEIKKKEEEEKEKQKQQNKKPKEDKKEEKENKEKKKNKDKEEGTGANAPACK